MKKIIVLLVGISIIGLLGWMGYSSVLILDMKQKREELTNSLSSIFESLDIAAKIPEGTTLLMYFNRECEHCRWEVKQISENIDQFSNINIALVSLEHGDSVRPFLQKHSLEEFFVETDPEKIMATFSGGVPQIFIYKENELERKFKGEVKIELLIKSLK